MSEAPLLFDRHLLRQRRARFAAEIEEREVLLAYVAHEIAERVEIILRAFPRALDLGAYRGLLGRTVADLPSVGNVVYAESVLAYTRRCPTPAVVCDEDVLPFKDGAFNLIVSGLALHRVNDLPGSLIQVRRALAPDGLFMAAVLGANALTELRQCLLKAEEEIDGGVSPRVAPFGDVRAYGALLQRTGFALPVAGEEEEQHVVLADAREQSVEGAREPLSRRLRVVELDEPRRRHAALAKGRDEHTLLLQRR